MIRKSTWILLALFVAALAFAWGFQRFQAQREAQITPTVGVETQPLLDIQESTLASLRVENDQGKFLVLGRNTEGLWTVLEPKGEGETDASQAESAITQLISLRSQFSLEMPDSLEKYGLLNPTHTITVAMNGGEKHILQVGSEAPAVSGYYIRLDNGFPQVVSKYSLDPVLEMIEKPPYVPTDIPTLPAEASGTPGATEGTEDLSTQPSTPVITPTATPQP